MALTYQLFTSEEAFLLGLMPKIDNHRGPSYVIFRVEDGKYTYLGNDGGEPEDKIFYRDFGWVLSELEYAKTYGETYMKPSTKIATPSDERQAEIRKNADDFKARRDGATSPEARAKYRNLLNQLRSECKHPNTSDVSQSIDCNDCGLSW